MNPGKAKDDQSVDTLALERIIKDQFGASLDIASVILDHAEVSRTAEATVFMTSKKQLYVYIDAKSRLLLSDVKKIVTRMGLKAEMFMPPKGKPNYFDDIGREKFREVFPGRGSITDNDIVYYRTLAPYNPSLAIISEVKDGAIYCFDSDAKGGWRVATKFTYRRIKAL